ncbi:MAG: dTDP-4-dehydrorhamnose reductase [Gammaproteobacteria bacterium]|nr:dTDP-4-dehydrorhamnose reductase [Sideroxydans sp.]MBU3903113.1 dTDP-4-dehydrorhamnose reductase [Gammaproteobacteria bacterium]MBU4045204.1 dTDP-4-dehydrorhamnose reductase [Gammaproteobacteria bacterium]
MRTILLTGANGQVGWELQRALAPLGKVVALTRQQLDLGSPDAIRAALRQYRPDIIVNPAAYTAVDKAESEPDLAQAVNGTAPGILAEEARLSDALLVHYSTDYVFDGSKAVPYSEHDTPNPQSVYGKTKLAGEQAIQAVGGRHLILRTSWVYGVHGGNFVKTVLRLARERDSLRIVNDQFGAPTWARLLAQNTSNILQQLMMRPEDSKLGLYHLTAAGSTNWYDYAQEIVRLARLHDRVLRDKPLAIQGIPTREYPLPATRPANSVLSTEKIKDVFGLILPQWEEDLAECLQLLLSDPAS